jgi:hypothetical protein
MVPKSRRLLLDIVQSEPIALRRSASFTAAMAEGLEPTRIPSVRIQPGEIDQPPADATSCRAAWMAGRRIVISGIAKFRLTHL